MVYILNSRYSPRIYASEVGSPTKEVYKKVFDECENCYKLAVTQIVDSYAQIQSYLNLADVALTCKRAINGDTSLLCRSKGEYVDISSLPGDYNSMIRSFKEAERCFNNLPKEVTEGHNLKSFIKNISTVEGVNAFNEKMHNFYHNAVEKPTSVVEEGVSNA